MNIIASDGKFKTLFEISKNFTLVLQTLEKKNGWKIWERNLTAHCTNVNR